MTTRSDEYRFPENFLWGTATSSHQVEGGQTNNDWWAAEQQGGYVFEDQKSGLACDWWRNAEQDFDRMAAMGMTTHRMSLEWSRIQPKPGVWSHDALQRYREMIIGLLQRGIQPMITLHHFTSPLWFSEMGGWENPKSPAMFDAYVNKAVSALGDLVELWCTINEPMVMIAQAYLLGNWPPGKQSLNAGLQVALNMARAHGLAYHSIHRINPAAQVGLAKHIVVWHPRRVLLPTDRFVTWLVNRISNHIFLEGVTHGVVRIPGRRAVPLPEAEDTLDWLGINYYQRFRLSLKLRSLLGLFFPQALGDLVEQSTKPGHQKGPGGWGEIYAGGLFRTLKSMLRYRTPIYITENGIPDRDDRYRPAFIATHLHQLWRAMQEGVPVRGYYHWSLVDNFEWSEGYNPEFRFGLFGVNFKTQERIPRTSGQFYEKIINQNGIGYEATAQYAPRALGLIYPDRLPTS
jgi:beta-glucosidase